MPLKVKCSNQATDCTFSYTADNMENDKSCYEDR